MQPTTLETMRTREFMEKLSAGDYDDCATAIIVSTSYAGDAAAIRSVASDRGLADDVLVLEYDDVENPKRPTALTGEMARQAVSFLRAACAKGASRCLMVCDGGFSRSAAFCAAWDRVSGRSDVGWWVQPEKYSPNLLVYRRVLEAGGVELTDGQVSRLGELKEAMLGFRIAKAGVGAPSAKGGLTYCAQLSPRQKQAVLSLGCEGPAGVTELRERLDLPASSAYSLMRELEGLGLVEKGADGRRKLTTEGELASREVSVDGGYSGGGYDKRDMAGRSVRGFKKEYFYLSNFFEIPVELDGIEYRNSEAAYQAGRCKEEAEKRAFSELDAGAARKRAHHEVETRDDWEVFRFEHMRRVVSAKFHQNLDLAWELVHLDGELVELNDWHDNYWGDCCCPDCSGIPGQNMLGLILMDVRKELRDGVARNWPRAQHMMKLASEPFDKVASGAKTIELRLYDEKRRKVQPGDAIIFLPLESFRSPVGAVVTGIAVYPSFEDLFRDVDLAKCGYAPDEIEGASPADMDEYYPAEEREACSAVAISFVIPPAE